MAYAARHGLDVVAEFMDACTGTEEDRPGFLDMVSALLENGTRIILVGRLGRLAGI